MEIIIEGERIVVYELKEKDWEAIHSYASQEDACRFQPWGPNSIQDTKDFVGQVLKDSFANPRTRYVFSVFERSKGKVIGHSELNINNQCAELSYIIHPDYWGLGYATEVAKELIGFGFENLKLHRIYATCDVRNLGSSRVLEKAGMTQEGKLRENLLIKDGWRDSFIYGMLESEWR